MDYLPGRYATSSMPAEKDGCCEVDLLLVAGCWGAQ